MALKDCPVTHEECATFRKSMTENNDCQSKDIRELIKIVATNTTQIEHLISQNKWFMGILSSLIVSGLVYIITTVLGR